MEKLYFNILRIPPVYNIKYYDWTGMQFEIIDQSQFNHWIGLRTKNDSGEILINEPSTILVKKDIEFSDIYKEKQAITTNYRLKLDAYLSACVSIHAIMNSFNKSSVINIGYQTLSKLESLNKDLYTAVMIDLNSKFYNSTSDTKIIQVGAHGELITSMTTEPLDISDVKNYITKDPNDSTISEVELKIIKKYNQYFSPAQFYKNLVSQSYYLVNKEFTETIESAENTAGCNYVALEEL